MCEPRVLFCLFTFQSKATMGNEASMISRKTTPPSLLPPPPSPFLFTPPPSNSSRRGLCSFSLFRVFFLHRHKSFPSDTNNDGLVDSLELNARLPLGEEEEIHSVKMLVFFRTRLRVRGRVGGKEVRVAARGRIEKAVGVD